MYTAQTQVALLREAIRAYVVRARLWRLFDHGKSTSVPPIHVEKVITTADKKLPSARERTVKYVAK
jgi:hypothetical protein